MSLLPPETPTFFQAQFLPAGKNDLLVYDQKQDLQRPHTLAVFLHGDMEQSAAGPLLDSYFTGWFDKDYGGVAAFPTSLRLWNAS